MKDNEIKYNYKSSGKNSFLQCWHTVTSIYLIFIRYIYIYIYIYIKYRNYAYIKNDTFHKHPSVNGIILRQIKAKIQILFPLWNALQIQESLNTLVLVLKVETDTSHMTFKNIE